MAARGRPALLGDGGPGDPFDRLLIAQARVEGLSVVTADRRFGAYDVPLVLA